MEYEDWDMDTWKAVEKEYLDKVTMKNEHLVGASMLLHKLTPDNSELLYVRYIKIGMLLIKPQNETTNWKMKPGQMRMRGKYILRNAMPITPQSILMKFTLPCPAQNLL